MKLKVLKINECWMCGSKNIKAEKRPGGKKQCVDCGHILVNNYKIKSR